MKQLHKQASNEQLNAFLDGQLSPEEAIQFQDDLQQDPALRAHLDELRRVRLLAQCALYKRLPAKDESIRRPIPKQRWQWAKGIVVAGLLIGIGFWAGFASQPTQSPSDLQAYLSTGKLTLQPAALAIGRGVKAIYHISTADPEKIRGALDEMEILLGVYAKSGRTLHLEIIANAEGLNLLRADTSPVRERIYALQRNYENIKFLACGKTIEHLQLVRNMQNVPLLPGVSIVPSALDQVILRLQDGWSYIRV